MYEIMIWTGLVVGSFLCLSACWVWLGKQIFGTGGFVLCVFGAVLIGLSVWSNVSIEAGPFRAELTRLQQEVEEAQKTVRLTQAATLELNQELRASRSQLVALTQAIEPGNGGALTEVRAGITADLQERDPIFERLAANARERGVVFREDLPGAEEAAAEGEEQ